MYIDYSLKFSSKEEADKVLLKEEGFVYPNTDIIGVIYRNEKTPEEPLMVPTGGYHANIRSAEEIPELEKYRVFPLSPVRVWASESVPQSSPETVPDTAAAVEPL